jgi:hypothetical protein
MADGARIRAKRSRVLLGFSLCVPVAAFGFVHDLLADPFARSLVLPWLAFFAGVFSAWRAFGLPPGTATVAGLASVGAALASIAVCPALREPPPWWVIAVGLPLPLGVGLLLQARRRRLLQHASAKPEPSHFAAMKPLPSETRRIGVLAAADMLLRLACWLVFTVTAVTVSAALPAFVWLLLRH